MFQRNGIYYVAIRANGHRVVKSTGCKNKKKAREVEAVLREDIRTGKWFKFAKGRTRTFSDMWQKYKELYHRQRDMYSVKHLMAAFGERVLAEIESDEVTEYIRMRQNADPKPSDVTIDKEIALAKRMFKVAQQSWQWVDRNPFVLFDKASLLDTEKERERVISIEEELALLEASPVWLRQYILFGIHTGCRTGEILKNVTWDEDCVQMGKRVLKIQRSKRKPGEKRKLKYKLIPITKTLFDVMLSLSFDKGESTKVFTQTEDAIRYHFLKAAEKAGIKDIRPHDFRRTFATRLRNKGVIPTDIKVLMGQSVPDVLEIHYTHDYIDHLRQCVSKLEEYYEDAGVGERVTELLG